MVNDINWPKVADCAKCKQPISITASKIEQPRGVFWHTKCWPGIAEADKLNKSPNKFATFNGEK